MTGRRFATFSSLSFSSTVLLACAALIACSGGSSDDSEAADPVDPSAAPDGSPEPVTPGTPDPAGHPDGGADAATEPKPDRPEPQSSIRECGSALTTPTKLDTRFEWARYLTTPIGSGVLVSSPLQRTKPWVTGTATRVTMGASGAFSSGPDESPANVISTFGLLQYKAGDAELSNYDGTVARREPATLWYLAPSPTLLTYFSGFGRHEVVWSIGAPTRLPGASTVASDRFVRGISAGAFFGYEVALLFPSTCAVGALSDALERKALVKDATTDSGIFTLARRAVIQDVLVKNGVTMFVRVIGNKRHVAVENLLATTTCSTGKLEACASLVASLAAVSPGSLLPQPSDLAKLQTDTDTGWSLMSVSTAPMSIVGP